MHSVQTSLSSLQLGKPQSLENLTMVPLLATEDREPDYLTLDDALARGHARVTEVSDAGSVPELLFVNTGNQSILLLDGEELVGAKQNRTLNLTILAPARATLKIPVSCVEAGRWQPVSPEFGSEGRVFYAAGRAKRAGHVTASLRETGAPMSRQGEVWADISEKASRLGTRSATDAMASFYDGYQAPLDAFRKGFYAEPIQAGALFLVDGRIAGMDLFDAPATLRRTLPKLVTSYALDALDSGLPAAQARNQTADAFVAQVAKAQFGTFPAIGAGTDLRLEEPGLAGGGLAVDDRLVHLCAFPLARESGRGDNDRSKLASLRARRRHWQR